MAEEIQHGNHTRHGDYERRDIGVAGILYFIVGLAIATFIVHLVLAGLYDFLDKRSRNRQPAISPLIANVPANEDTRQIPKNYPEKAFPEPRLETDERGQLNDIRLDEERKLNSYGWVDEQAGTVRIPIDRAMDLLAQRGLPVRSEAAKATTSGEPSRAGQTAATETAEKKGSMQ
jgi:hypothetical protein